jgi:TP901-1 family phage major tail protein
MPTIDYLYELHTSIIAALDGDATLAALINGVYSNVPADAKYPYVAVDNITAKDSSTRTTNGWHVKLSINTFSCVRSNIEASNILAEIRRVLDGAALSPTGCKVTAIREDNNNIRRQRDGKTWEGRIDFIIILQEGSGSFVGDGNQFIIKIGDGDTPTEAFAEIGGLRNVSISLKNKIMDSSNLNAGKWRALVSNGGVSSIAISGGGFFSDSGAEEKIRTLAFAGGGNNYEIILGDKDKISGSFLISSYKRSGDINTEEEFSISLESSGTIVFTAG